MMLGFCFRTVRPSRFTSSGRRGSAMLTRFCTSRVAMSMSVPTSKVTFMFIWPVLVLLEEMYAMPGVPLTCTSTGVATVCSTVWASAPV